MTNILILIVSILFFSISRAENQTQLHTENFGLLKDWGGSKVKLLEKGIDLNLTYKSDYSTIFSGGVSKKSTYFDNTDITMDFDLEKLANLKGLSVFLYWLNNNGGNPSTFVGNKIVTSNIEAADTFKLYEAYIQKKIDTNFSAILGLRDLNAEYYSTETSKIFLNSAFRISPSLSQTGVNGPSIFPTTALSFTVSYKSENMYYFRTGLFNARSGDPNNQFGNHVYSGWKEGSLIIWESGFEQDDDQNSFKYGLGAWTYTKASSTIITGKDSQNNSGFYLLADQKLNSKVSAFAKFGVASAEINQFSSGMEIGISYQNLFNLFENDALALGYIRGNISSDYQTQNNTAEDESVVELCYKMEIIKGFAITPDFQYVIRPNASKTIENASVGSVRFELNF